jgi:hypothetical protein
MLALSIDYYSRMVQPKDGLTLVGSLTDQEEIKGLAGIAGREDLTQ